MSDIEYKIALVGPTRVGKTSLVSSILAQAQDALSGTPASMKAQGSTFARIADNVNELDGALAHGTFEPEAIRSGTSDRSIYDLAFQVGKTRLPVRFLDYPGGWIRERGPEWEECAEWIMDSSVLIVPVDAVVAMQCATKGQEEACRRRLNIAEVTEVVRDWAKQRNATKTPGTLILAPVKCESYLVAPGVTAEKANEMYRRLVDELYQDLFGMLEAELGSARHVGAYYVPVNTIGCVDLVDADWRMAEDGKLECHPMFRVIPPGKRKPEGGIDILILLARMLANAENTRDKGFFTRLWRFFTGEGKELQAAILKLNGLKLGARVREIQFARNA